MSSSLCPIRWIQPNLMVVIWKSQRLPGRDTPATSGQLALHEESRISRSQPSPLLRFFLWSFEHRIPHQNGTSTKGRKINIISRSNIAAGSLSSEFSTLPSNHVYGLWGKRGSIEAGSLLPFPRLRYRYFGLQQCWGR